MPRVSFKLGRPWLVVARSDTSGISFALLDVARDVAELPSVQVTSFLCPLRSQVLFPAVLMAIVYVQIPENGSLSLGIPNRVSSRARSQTPQ